MSKGHWRTAKRTEPFPIGKCAEERVRQYVSAWRKRCYSNDIPDEVQRKVEASGRAPSYRAIAIAILRNDLMLKALGFGGGDYERIRELTYLAGGKAEFQGKLFPDKGQPR